MIVPDRTHPYIDSYASAESAIGGALIELTVYYGARIIRLFLSSSTTVAQVTIVGTVVYSGVAHISRDVPTLVGGGGRY